MADIHIFPKVLQTDRLDGPPPMTAWSCTNREFTPNKPDQFTHTRSFWATVRHTVATWHIRWARRSDIRRHYLCESDSVLEDLGVTRDELETEALKPFWRA